MSQCDYTYKFIVVGDVATGKSTLVKRGNDDRYVREYNPTIGVDFAVWNVNVVNSKNEQKRVKLHIWDTAGQEMYKAIVKSYYRSAVAAFIVFDLSEKDALESIPEWIKVIRDESAILPKHMILIGNKADLSRREVTRVEIDKMVEKYELAAYLETSAKIGTNVREMFNMLAQDVYNTYTDDYFKKNAAEIIGVKKNYISPISLDQQQNNNRQNKCCVIQ